jgi:hypothetical protein
MKDAQVLSWRGDVDPLAHGGGVLYEKDGEIWLEWFEAADGDARGDVRSSDRFLIYRVEVPKDVFAAWDWVKPKAVAAAVGRHVETLVRLGRRADPQARATVVEDVAAVEGWSVLDDDPLVLTAAELRDRWPLRLAGAFADEAHEEAS